MPPPWIMYGRLVLPVLVKKQLFQLRFVNPIRVKKNEVARARGMYTHEIRIRNCDVRGSNTSAAAGSAQRIQSSWWPTSWSAWWWRRPSWPQNTILGSMDMFTKVSFSSCPLLLALSTPGASQHHSLSWLVFSASSSRSVGRAGSGGLAGQPAWPTAWGAGWPEGGRSGSTTGG